MLDFYWPQSFGEQLAFLSAAVTFVLVLAFLVAPRRMMTACGMDMVAGSRPARAMFAPFPLALAGAAMLFAQPLFYLVLGMAWAIAAVLWLIALVFGGKRGHAVGIVVSCALAAGPLAFALGYLA